MDAEYANYYTREVMLILIREFQSPDEEMKKIVLKVGFGWKLFVCVVNRRYSTMLILFVDLCIFFFSVIILLYVINFIPDGGCKCALPEKIHNHPMESHWKFLGGVGGGGES